VRERLDWVKYLDESLAIAKLRLNEVEVGGEARKATYSKIVNDSKKSRDYQRLSREFHQCTWSNLIAQSIKREYMGAEKYERKNRQSFKMQERSSGGGRESLN